MVRGVNYIFSLRSIRLKDKTLLVLLPDYPSEHGEFNGCNVIKNQITYSRKSFKKVIVIAPVLFTFGLTPHDKYCFNYSYDNVDVYFPRCLFFPRVVKAPYITNYKKIAIDTRLAATIKTIDENNLSFDVIHARFTYPSGYIASELKKKYNVPVIFTVHEDSGWFEEERLMNHPRLVQAWRSADVITRENTTELSILKEYNQNIVVVPAGYDSSTYGPVDKALCRKMLHLHQDDKILFTFGFLDERKGFQDLITAISYLPAYHVKCYISGSGPYKQKLHNCIKRLKLEKNVFIIDHLDDIQITIWINAADLFIFPSLRESFGVTQIEALGCGVPVIASDNVGSFDVINDTCGYLFKAGNAKDLALKIIKGLNTEWDKIKILDYAKTTYSWEVVSKQYDDLYKTTSIKYTKPNNL